MNKYQYLNEKEVSQMTSISLPTLRMNRHLKQGIPYSKIGRSVRYNFQDVIDYMENSKVKFENGERQNDGNSDM